jgi:hypothetical protein
VNHKIDIHSCNDAISTCAQLAELVEKVAEKLRAMGDRPVFDVRGTDYSPILKSESSFFHGTWRVPASQYGE